MYKYMYNDNNGNEEIVTYDDEQKMLEDIDTTMQDIYDNLRSAYEDKDVVWLNRLLDVSKVTEIYVPETNISFSITLLDTDEHHVTEAHAVYTGGNIWIFHGRCSDGNWFLTDDYGCSFILDTNPGDDWENCCYDEWLRAHSVKELEGKERTDFTDELADFMLKHDCGPITDDEVKGYKEYWRAEL